MSTYLLCSNRRDVNPGGERGREAARTARAVHHHHGSVDDVSRAKFNLHQVPLRDEGGIVRVNGRSGGRSKNDEGLRFP
jgi:hypothetical protein